MHQRINITLPKDTVKLIDRVSKRGNRSHLIDKAVQYFVRSIGRTNLKKLLDEGAKVRADRDLELAEEWFDLDEEVHQQQHR